MASYTVSFAKHATLMVNTADTVTLTSNVSDDVEVFNRSASGDIYFTIDGTVPTVGANDTYIVGPGTSVSVLSRGTPDVVKLISSTANLYSVTGTQDNER